MARDLGRVWRGFTVTAVSKPLDGLDARSGFAAAVFAGNVSDTHPQALDEFLQAVGVIHSQVSNHVAERSLVVASNVLDLHVQEDSSSCGTNTDEESTKRRKAAAKLERLHHIRTDTVMSVRTDGDNSIVSLGVLPQDHVQGSDNLFLGLKHGADVGRSEVVDQVGWVDLTSVLHSDHMNPRIFGVIIFKVFLVSHVILSLLQFGSGDQRLAEVRCDAALLIGEVLIQQQANHVSGFFANWGASTRGIGRDINVIAVQRLTGESQGEVVGIQCYRSADRSISGALRIFRLAGRFLSTGNKCLGEIVLGLGDDGVRWGDWLSLSVGR